MIKKIFSKIVILTLIVSSFGIANFAFVQADDETPPTTTDVGNVSPVPTVTPSDGGSAGGSGVGNTDGNPTNVGSNVTFTATAKDINTDQYYLAVCKDDSVAAGGAVDTPPTCDGDGPWAVSAASVASDAVATVTYQTVIGDIEANNWFAFVCDNSDDAACYPTNALPPDDTDVTDDVGDKGFAAGTIRFTDVPADASTVTIGGDFIYEFDTGAVEGCTGGQNACVVIAGLLDGESVAWELAVSSESQLDDVHMTSRGEYVYVYADTEGAAGNDIALAKSEPSGNVITLSGAALSGGDTENASPFYVNHAPAFGTVTVTDSGDGTIAPGDTLKFKLVNDQIDDGDSDPAQDTINMYICSGEEDMGGVTTAFDYTANTCTNGTLLCSDTAVDPTTEDASCTDVTNSISVPTAHATYDFVVYVEDNHDFPGTGTNGQTFDVIDVAPVLTSYTTADGVIIAAGGSDTVTRAVTFTDDNGDNDPTALDMVFFEDTSVDDDCISDENNCYRYDNIDPASPPAGCTVSNRSAAGTGKTATGGDNSLSISCDYTVWFNATASANWEMSGTATDGLGDANFTDSNDNTSVAALSGLDLGVATINYGAVPIGGTSAHQETAMSNMGNQTLDIYIQGTDMARDGGGGSIPAAQQKWNNAIGDWDWDDPEADPGPWGLEYVAGGTGEGTGCINRDINVRGDHTLGDTDESISWKIRIPSSQAAGSYTGANTFTTTSSDTCITGTLN